MSKKTLALLVLIVILTPVLSLLISFRATAFNQSFYEKQFKENNVYEKFNLTEQEVNDVNKELLGYILHGKKDEKIKNDIFTEREKLHLIDVKNLVQWSLFVFYFVLIVFLVLFFSLAIKDKKKLVLAVIGGGIFTYILLLLLFLLTRNFDLSFTAFHELFFTNNLWMLDKTTALIRMFPEAFFYSIFREIILNALFIANVFTIGGIFLLLLSKKDIKPKEDTKKKEKRDNNAKKTRHRRKLEDEQGLQGSS